MNWTFYQPVEIVNNVDFSDQSVTKDMLNIENVTVSVPSKCMHMHIDKYMYTHERKFGSEIR